MTDLPVPPGSLLALRDTSRFLPQLPPRRGAIRGPRLHHAPLDGGSGPLPERATSGLPVADAPRGAVEPQIAVVDAMTCKGVDQTVLVLEANPARPTPCRLNLRRTRNSVMSKTCAPQKLDARTVGRASIGTAACHKPTGTLQEPSLPHGLRPEWAYDRLLATGHLRETPKARPATRLKVAQG
jgi:hypothetical protein